MDIRKTKEYYETLDEEELCSCAYCRNYYQEIRNSYPVLENYLKGIGIAIEKPFETMPLEPYNGMIEYIAVQYIVMGDSSDFKENDIAGVHISIAQSHPMTDIKEKHFVIELSEIRLKWTM